MNARSQLLDQLIIRYFSAEIEGINQIPIQGGALLVGNHALWGIDTLILRSLLRQAGVRPLTFLGDRNLWKVPFSHLVLDAINAIEGSRENAIQHLQNGELVCVYPGGIDDSWKNTHTHRHRLMWNQRRGFAEVALRAGVPVIPIAGLGIDDIYTVHGREPWIGRRLFGSPKYDFPIAHGWLGTLIPRRVPLKFSVLPAISTIDLDPNDPAAIELIRTQTQFTLENFLQTSPTPKL